jgi:hypothetical protein
MFGLGYITGAVSKVAGGAKWVGQKLIDKAAEYLEKPWEVIKGVRDSILGVMTSTVDSLGETVKPSVKVGANIDKAAADIAAETNAVIGANKIDVLEGTPLAEERAKISEHLEKSSSDLNRYKSEDQKIIAEEEAIEKQWATAVTTESGPDAPPLTPADDNFIGQIASFINTMRRQEGKGDPLKIDPKLSEEARKRAALITHRGDSNLVPYRYLRTLGTKPLSRKNDIPIPPNISADQAGLIEKIEKDPETGAYTGVMKESDHDFAERIRKAKAQREAFEVTNLNFTFDLRQESYPLDSDPRALLERLCRDEVVKKDLLLNMKKIGVGIHRDGTKVVLSFVMTNETPSEGAIEAPAIDRPEDYRTNEWWMSQIADDKKRLKRSPQEYSLQELFDGNVGEGRPAFRSGYSLYEYSRFRDQIQYLKAEGFDVDIMPAQFFPKETINDGRYHTLHIPLKANGQPTEMKLIMGTDIVAVPKTVGDNEVGGGSNFFTLDAYLEKLKKKLEPAQEQFPGGSRQENQTPSADELKKQFAMPAHTPEHERIKPVNSGV